ncbi:DedA family protein [Chthonobacter albigriseus]|uniref:DedA family protein n=1 Tax=Chthonobacter albigriseus TaxID=1683161 RepID=UPI0015EF04EC|nr:DedA family protein [Chthonobacter albigriseus]
MIDSLMTAVGSYGAPALFLILAVNCFGLPFPTSLLLLAVGAIAADGDLASSSILAWGVSGAILGDQAGYWLGRAGGRTLLAAASDRLQLGPALARAEAYSSRWGAIGVFLTRWLLSPLGPYVNLVAGAARMPWILFTVSGILGETVWVSIYMGLGLAFADSVPALADLLGNVTWFLLAAAVTALIGWKLLTWPSSEHAPHGADESRAGRRWGR